MGRAAVDGLVQTLRGLGPLRLGAIAIVGVILLTLFVFLTTRLAQPDLALLYSDLDFADSGEIVTRLEAAGVPYELSGNGTSIFVPSDQVDRLRVQMAQQGLPAGGSIGYEIFDRTDGFGTTNFVQNVNRLRALEGELARTIGTINGIRQARVHLVLPERELFSRDAAEPTASVFLRLGAGRLGSEQIIAIQSLVAAAVPRMAPDAVSIVDNRGNLLARGPASEDDLRLMDTEEMRLAYERRLTERVEDLVSRSVGYGNVRANITVDMDFDRVTVSEERYDPDSQVARSTQIVEEETEANDSDGFDPVTVANNLPEAEAVDPLAAGGTGATATERASRTEETTNFEISRTVSNTVRETGSVRRLSIALLVDGTYTAEDGGPMVYTPRSAEELQQIEALVRSAVGFDADRGDTLEVINLQFIDPEMEAMQNADTGPLFLGLTREDIFGLVEMLVLGVVAILVILLVIRPLLTRVLDGNKVEITAEDYGELITDANGNLQPALAGPGGVPALAGPGGSALTSYAGGSLAEMSDGSGEGDGMIDLQKVDGQVRASSLRKVGEIINSHPEEAVGILRSWLYQDA